MIHTQNCTKEQMERDFNRDEYYDERYVGEEGYYAMTRKEVLHNLLMVYQASLSSGKYNAAIKALQLYGKEVGLFRKRKAYPLCADDLTYPEIQELMTKLSDMYPEDEAKMETKAAQDFYKSTESTGGFDFSSVSEGVTPDNGDQEQTGQGNQDSDQEKGDPIPAQTVDQFTAETGKEGWHRPQGCKQSELGDCKAQVTKPGQIDEEGGSAHTAGDIFNRDGRIQHGQTVPDGGHHHEHQVGNRMQYTTQEKAPENLDFPNKGRPKKPTDNGGNDAEYIVNRGNFGFGEPNFKIEDIGHIVDHGVR